MSSSSLNNILNHTKSIYETVIAKVCQKLQEDSADEGLADEVIDQFKEVWKKKIEERKVYILTAELSHSQANEVQKKDSSSNNQSRQRGESLQVNNNKNELSDELTNQLIQQISSQNIQQKDQQIQKLTHNHPNPDIQGHTMKKVKTEDTSSYQTSYSTSAKQEEKSPMFGATTYYDPPPPTEVLEVQKQHSMKNVKIEEQEINYMEALDNQNDSDHDQQNEDEQNELAEKEKKKENKNEEFLTEIQQYETDSYICGYYSVMKKKTAKKFKIQFEKMIASIQGKDYIISSLSGDLEW